MPRRLTFALLAGAAVVFGANDPIWDELGLRSIQTSQHGGCQLTTWSFKDPTGGLGGWGQVGESSKKPPLLFGNQVVVAEGRCPADVAPLLSGVRNGPLPA